MRVAVCGKSDGGKDGANIDPTASKSWRTLSVGNDPVMLLHCVGGER